MREVTTQDKALAKAIVGDVYFVWTDVHKHIDWKSHMAQAFTLAHDVKGYQPSSRSCIACQFKALNIVREIADLPPIGGEASESLRERRVKVCRGDQEDGSEACEHLAWPGLNCGKCGCFVDVKASFKRFRCPINRWPIA